MFAHVTVCAGEERMVGPGALHCHHTAGFSTQYQIWLRVRRSGVSALALRFMPCEGRGDAGNRFNLEHRVPDVWWVSY